MGDNCERIKLSRTNWHGRTLWVQSDRRKRKRSRFLRRDCFLASDANRFLNTIWVPLDKKAAGSIPAASTLLRNEPFGENVEGLSYCGAYTSVDELAVR